MGEVAICSPSFFWVSICQLANPVSAIDTAPKSFVVDLHVLQKIGQLSVCYSVVEMNLGTNPTRE